MFNDIPVLALFLEVDSWFQGIYVFLRGHDILTAMNKHRNFW